MERLTYEKSQNRWDSGKYPTKYTSRHTFQEVVARLAAYEDTGLEPEEVSEYQRLCDSYVKAGLDAKFVQFCIDATQNGLSVDRIRELAQAERDGRLVVLPCKTTDTVYITELVFESGKQKRLNKPNGERVVSAQIDHVTIGGTTGEPVFDLCTETGGWYYSMEPNQFHLTREEAEAALRKGEEADDEAD